ncbi:hypothetical protein MSSD1_550 [Mycoplasmopsis synoviae]
MVLVLSKKESFFKSLLASVTLDSSWIILW